MSEEQKEEVIDRTVRCQLDKEANDLFEAMYLQHLHNHYKSIVAKSAKDTKLEDFKAPSKQDFQNVIFEAGLKSLQSSGG